jgi:pimeloyl-ACP methyl ester carboxylesterase
VLAHGFSGSSADFYGHIDQLAEARPVIAMDHRGHGTSTNLGAGDNYSMDLVADDLVSLLEAVADEPVDLLGHSMGGRVVLRLALARPDLVRSLIFMDTTAWEFKNPDPAIAEMMGDFMATFDPTQGLPDLGAMVGPETPLVEAATSAEVIAAREARSKQFDPWAMQALGSELWNGAADTDGDRLAEISCPVTVLAGEHDHPFVDHAPGFASGVADGECVVIEGAYHSPQLTHPVEWRNSIADHLRR